MPNVIEAPEFIAEEQDHQVATERRDAPSTKHGGSALRRVLRAFVGQDDTQSQASCETAIDRLARRDPYLYIRAICG